MQAEAKNYQQHIEVQDFIQVEKLSKNWKFILDFSILNCNNYNMYRVSQKPQIIKRTLVVASTEKKGVTLLGLIVK